MNSTDELSAANAAHLPIDLDGPVGGAIADPLAGGAPVFIGVNPTEYHGPHLSLKNDALCAHGLAERLAARMGWPFLDAGDLDVGVDPTPGPGSVHTPLAEVRAKVRAAIEAAAHLGARRVILSTFHGAPLHNAALDDALATAPVPVLAPFHAVLEGALLAPPAARRDFHGGRFETSVALALAPDSVSPELGAIPDCPDFAPAPLLACASRLALRAGRARLSAELDFAAQGTGWHVLRPFPGFTGQPRLATAAEGERHVARILDAYVALARQVFDGRHPHPRAPLAWARHLRRLRVG